jgi:hypothetical protein
MQKRYDVYKSFKDYVQQKDERPMDEICKSDTSDEFSLQVQQKFLKDYIKKNPSWSKLLLYHEIGAGKTCTAITLAEEHLSSNPKASIKVILPARLKTNFVDELISPCGMEAYMTAEDFKRFHDASTPTTLKKVLKAKYNKAIDAKYTILSFEKFKSMAMKEREALKKWVKDFTKDSLIVVDEVHNLLSDKYDIKKARDILQTGTAPKGVKGMNTILFRLLTKFAHPSCKMIIMTATPIFDNILQLKELVYALNPEEAEIKKNAKVSDIIDFLRGKISYFPGTSKNAYPKVEHTVHEIPLSRTQDEISFRVQTSDTEDEFKEEFLSKQRQVSLACLPDQSSVKNHISEVISDMTEYCPKIKKLLEVIKANPGKHVVFSNFVQSGLKVVEAALRKRGWVSIDEVLKDPDTWNKHKYKVFALWDGSVKDHEKQLIKSVVNNATDNLHGQRIRVILGSPSIKEGVSFKHIQHMHLLDPVWNISAKAQVEGRAIRYCSHVDIKPQTHKPLKRRVVVNIYKSMPIKGGDVTMTCDQMIYDHIIEKKKKVIQAGESALKKVALDHYLFRNMYMNTAQPAPKAELQRTKSNVGLINDEDIYLNMKTRPNKDRNTCPKPRRPSEVDGKCPANYELRKNPQGNDCCYKLRRTKSNNTHTKAPKNNNSGSKQPTPCPKARRPIDGKCQDGYIIKKNKNNEPCCYKSSRKV